MESKDKLKNAFKTLFVQKPIEKISVTELSTLAGVNRKTFYRQFYTMNDVLDAVETDLLNDLKTEIATIQSLSIHNLLLILNSLILKNAEFYKTLIQRHNNSFFLNDAQKILKAGLAERINADTASIEQNFKLEFISGGIMQLYVSWLQNSSQISLTELALSFNQHSDLFQFFFSDKLWRNFVLSNAVTWCKN